MSSAVPTDGVTGQAAATTNPPPPTQVYHTSKGQVPLLTSLKYSLWSKSLQLVQHAEILWRIVDGLD